ncbi:hypothetical protein DFH05DRAFT_1407105, partial [Lentinula detonsa]
ERGSYIWGRYVHNTCIERMWVDVTVGVGDNWRQQQSWNTQLQFWAESWNFHPITIGNGPNQHPEEMFRFNMLVHELRTRLEVFGVDWNAYEGDAILWHLCSNYANEGNSSWLGHRGPLTELSGVEVSKPPLILTAEEIS